MSATTSQRGTADRPVGGVETAGHRPRAFEYVMGVLRLAVGWIFLWAFLDKLFGLGYSTPSKGVWLNGGHPTLGFLKFGAKGPFVNFYHGIAGATWADWLFMLGLLGIGVALMAGVAMRLAAAAGALLLVLMWTAVLPPENNPIIDDHIIDALLLVALALGGAGHALGLGAWWSKLPVVRDHTWLQ